MMIAKDGDSSSLQIKILHYFMRVQAYKRGMKLPLKYY